MLTWIKFTCLNLKSNETTTYTPIKTPWLLIAPHHIRLRFLQNLNDGDGYVNIKYQKVGNASGVNSSLVSEILLSLGVHSIINGPRTIIEQQTSIIHATELPYFLHANGRQKDANKLAEMIANRMLHSRMPITYEIGKYIKALKKQGYSTGEITEKVFDKFNICYYPRRVRIFLKKE